ncbi:MAG: NAD(P)/FAD-dependent oxidoreductase [Actinobacteria bacterium]|nr:NAD(P)/FAD-dependent oxidoreductase [Actinomycetota bacterium]
MAVVVEHFDVIVVGAGLSGIGAAYHLTTRCPDRSFVILEGRSDIGGTWDLFRYPGVRSDSDMHTLGFSFKPWTHEKSIADGPAIMDYLRETVHEHHIDEKIRFNNLVSSASWSTADERWTLVSHDAATGTETSYTCNFLFMCSGYYSYKGGHEPEFLGRERFRGTVVHPQKWPEDLDYAGKRVVVIGSGATAVTLVPAMADRAAKVTMLQRTPTWMVSRPDTDAVANRLGRLLPKRVAYAITRLRNTTFQQIAYKRTRTKPDRVRAFLLDQVRKELPDGFDVDKHFTPPYNPWDQRLCLVPNSDLFRAIKAGKVDVVTDKILNWTESGIDLVSGEHLYADIIVTATGLELVTLGEMDFVVDGAPVDFAKTWTYKGLAYSGVPNLVSTFGYINASWTLRADLISEYVCRLLNHMRATGTRICRPTLRPGDAAMPERRWIENFSAGYMERVMYLFPRQGDREPWINPQNFARDKKMFRKSPVDDGVMIFG